MSTLALLSGLHGDAQSIAQVIELPSSEVNTSAGLNALTDEVVGQIAPGIAVVGIRSDGWSQRTWLSGTPSCWLGRGVSRLMARKTSSPLERAKNGPLALARAYARGSPSTAWSPYFRRPRPRPWGARRATTCRSNLRACKSGRPLHCDRRPDRLLGVPRAGTMPRAYRGRLTQPGRPRPMDKFGGPRPTGRPPSATRPRAQRRAR